MKKIIVSLFLAFALSLNAQGQWSFGPKIGLNISNLSGISVANVSSKGASEMIAGMCGGGFVNYSFSDRIGAQAELLFSMQGGNDRGIVTRQNYLNLPLLLDIKPLKQTPFSVFAGVQFGYCMGRNAGGLKLTPYRYYDVSAVIGAQYVFFKHLILGLRCNVGLTPSLVNHEIEMKGERNNVVQLSTGWSF